MFAALPALLALLLRPADAGTRAEFAPRKPAPPDTTLGAWLQPRLTWQQTDADVADADDDGGNGGSGDGISGDGGTAFSLRRARVWAGATWLSRTDPAALDGWRGLSLDAHLAVELAGAPHLADGYLDLRLGHPLQIRVGRFPVPGAHDRQVDDERLLLPDRSASTRLLAGRDTGAAVHGFIGRHVLAWQLGAFNGDGGGTGSDTATGSATGSDGDAADRGSATSGGLRYAGRVEVSPLGGIGQARDLLRPDWRLLGHRGVPIGTYNPLTTMTLGAYASHEDQADGATQAAGVDLFLHWRPVNLAAAATLGRQLDDTGATTSSFGGWWVQAALFVPGIPWASDHLALLARLDDVDPRLDQAAVSALDPDQARRDLTVGAKLLAGRPLFAGMDDATLLMAWIVRQEPETTGYANDALLVSAQLAW